MRHFGSEPSQDLIFFFRLFFGLERLSNEFASASSAESRHGFPLLRVVSGILAKLHAFLEYIHSFVEAMLRALRRRTTSFEPRQRLLKSGFLGGSGFLTGVEFTRPNFSYSRSKRTF